MRFNVIQFCPADGTTVVSNFLAVSMTPESMTSWALQVIW